MAPPLPSSPMGPSQLWAQPDPTQMPSWVPAPSAHPLTEIVHQLSYQPPVLPDYGRLKQLQDESALQSAMGAIKPAATPGNLNPQAVGPNALSAYITMRNQEEMSDIKDQATREQSSTDLYNNMLRMAQIAGLNNQSKEVQTVDKVQGQLGSAATRAGGQVAAAGVRADSALAVEKMRSQALQTIAGMNNAKDRDIASQRLQALLAQLSFSQQRLGLAQDRNARTQGGYDAAQTDKAATAGQNETDLANAAKAFAAARYDVEDPENGPAGSLPGTAAGLPPVVGGIVNWFGKNFTADQWNNDPHVQALQRAVSAVRAGGNTRDAQELELLLPQFTDTPAVKQQKMERAIARIEELRKMYEQQRIAHQMAVGKGSSAQAPAAVPAQAPAAVPAQAPAAAPAQAPAAAPTAPAAAPPSGTIRIKFQGKDGTIKIKTVPASDAARYLSAPGVSRAD